MALSAPLITRKRGIQIGTETTKGTAVAGTADAIVFDLEINPTAPFIERRGSGRYMGHTAPGILGEYSGTCTFRAELRGNGTNAMDAGVSALLLACGLANAAETYTPTSTHATQKTVTLVVSEDGVKKSLRGCMGNVSMEGEFGKPIYCNFEFSGVWVAPTDVALPAFSPSAEAPPRLQAGTFTLGGESIKIGKFSFDLGNNVVPRADVDAVGGIAHYLITDRDPVVTIDPEADKIAGYDFFGAWLAGTEAALSLALGTGAGKAITIAVPKLQYRELSEGDRDGIQIYDLTGQANANMDDDVGDDEFSIVVAT